MTARFQSVGYQSSSNAKDIEIIYLTVYGCYIVPVRFHTKWMPWLLMAMALIAAFGYTHLEQDNARDYAAGVFGGSLGAALLLWGIEEIKRGRIRGKRVYVRRSDAPAAFFLLVIVKRIAPAVIMLGAAIWVAFFREA